VRVRVRVCVHVQNPSNVRSVKYLKDVACEEDSDSKGRVKVRGGHIPTHIHTSTHIPTHTYQHTYTRQYMLRRGHACACVYHDQGSSPVALLGPLL
jgi:hypothetical protein